MKHRCEECNSNISYEKESELYRCDQCGLITDNEGFVLYDVQDL